VSFYRVAPRYSVARDAVAYSTPIKMPDIDPAALSRPSVSLSTPILSNKTLAGSISGAPKIAKSSQIIPARIDLEPLYTALKAAIGNEKWAIYKESTTEFLIGRCYDTYQLHMRNYSHILRTLKSGRIF
jgi:hypothetical protein